MKTRILPLLLILLTSIATNSCREMPHNGHLSGQWQVLTIDHPDGTSTDPEGTIYYCFYRHVCQLTNTDLARITANCFYNDKDATIWLEFPYNNITDLYQWGLIESGSAVDPDEPVENDHVVVLKINHLSSSRLSFTVPGGNTLTLRKY